LKLTFRMFAFLAACGMASLSHAQHVNVAIGGEIKPGVYGQIQIGTGYPPPPVLYPQPVIIAQPARPPAVVVAPVYMHVPPGHAKKWDKHCHKYQACGTPVLFVKGPEHGHDHHPGHGKGKGHGHGRGNQQ
jgi:hypothetical protein